MIQVNTNSVDSKQKKERNRMRMWSPEGNRLNEMKNRSQLIHLLWPGTRAVQLRETTTSFFIPTLKIYHKSFSLFSLQSNFLIFLIIFL